MTEFSDTPALVDPSSDVVWSSFFVRLAREGEGGIWRGEVLHLQTHEKHRFASLAQIYDFIQKHAPGLPDQHTGVSTDATDV